MLKKVLIIALAVAVLAGVGVLSVQHYRQYKNKQDHAKAVTAQNVAIEQKAVIDHQTRLQAAYDKLYVECGKGKAAYDQLPALTKAKTPLPDCGSAVVQ